MLLKYIVNQKVKRKQSLHEGLAQHSTDKERHIGFWMDALKHAIDIIFLLLTEELLKMIIISDR